MTLLIGKQLSIATIRKRKRYGYTGLRLLFCETKQSWTKKVCGMGKRSPVTKYQGH